MNGLGLAAFDAAGFTKWYEFRTPIATAPATVDVTITVANVADDQYDSRIVVDFIEEEGITVDVDEDIACPYQKVRSCFPCQLLTVEGHIHGKGWQRNNHLAWRWHACHRNWQDVRDSVPHARHLHSHRILWW